MRRDVLKLLDDIRTAGKAIQEYTAGMSEEDYLAHRSIRRAVEREFEIIGEATRRMSILDATVAARIGGMSQVIAFRNVLAHGYDVVEDEIVWSMVIKKLPTLLGDVETLMAEGIESGP